MTNAFRKQLIGKTPLVTSKQSVTRKTSGKVPAAKPFVHPLMGETAKARRRRLGK